MFFSAKQARIACGPEKGAWKCGCALGLDVQAGKTNTMLTQTIVEAPTGHRTNMTVLVQDHFYSDILDLHVTSQATDKL